MNTTINKHHSSYQGDTRATIYIQSAWSLITYVVRVSGATESCVWSVQHWCVECQAMVCGVSSIGVWSVKQWCVECLAMVYGVSSNGV